MISRFNDYNNTALIYSRQAMAVCDIRTLELKQVNKNQPSFITLFTLVLQNAFHVLISHLSSLSVKNKMLSVRGVVARVAQYKIKLI